MNFYRHSKDQIITILKALQEASILAKDANLEQIDVTPTREAAHGDMATNAAMILAKSSGKNPKELAALIAEQIRLLPDITSVEIAGAGFINMRFAPSFWQRIIPVILKAGNEYGKSDVGKGKHINVEYVSANPTGPLHVGHGRGAVFGDALATLLAKAGFHVTKEYYINDAGSQVDKLAKAVAYRYLQALGEPVEDTVFASLYPGEYLIPVGEALKQQYGETLAVKQDGHYRLGEESEWLPKVRDFAIQSMMTLIREDLSYLGIEHDVFTSERSIHARGLIEEALAVLESKGLIYKGILEAPKGKTPDDWEPREQTLFKSTAFGDDTDRAIKKSDGSWTYFAPDIAYHYDKYKRGNDLLVDVLGADHGGYAKRIQSAVKALSDGKANLEVRLCQMVSLLRGGQQVKMSKRSGNIITAREVVEEVGKGVFRFIMLTRKNDAMLEFDFDKVTEQSKDNPVFYVQYAHARAKSVLKMANADVKAPTEVQLALLSHPAELELMQKMAHYPRMLESAAIAYEPHRIAFYLQELAAEFHSLWNRGNSDLSLRFIQKDAMDVTLARLALVRACSKVIASGLIVLGVEPLEEMR